MSFAAHLTHDVPPPPGVTLVDGGAIFCVYAGHADSVTLCLFDEGDTSGATERQVELTDRAHGWWYALVPGVGPGQRYGYRVDGPWAPVEGHRHNPAKLLLDPYARAVDGQVEMGPAVYGHAVDDDLTGDDTERSDLDSVGAVPRGVVLTDDFDWGADRPPGHALTDTLLYEVHVTEFTKLHPEVPEVLRGTYAGLAHPASIAHLKNLGVTAVELLPVHAFTHEPRLVRMGRTNHWGYNTLGFFAPHADYAAADDPQDVVDEFKGMVKLLHEAGIEVVLDVVYNHTCEQASSGATLSWRGLDNAAYYRLDDLGRDIDVTGCGNTLDLTDPTACRMVLDSLRYWVTECHVDGFRFDLAVALARGTEDEFDPNHPFLMALRTDPVLSRVKLIAEPWDVGMHGWRTGQFPVPFSEWNDRFRDAVRTFWVADLGRTHHGHAGHGINELATRLAGSQDLFGHGDRGTVASVNFVVAHDGFTAADLTAYDHKHNESNGEGNLDGSNHNRSWNHTVEGPTDDEAVLAARRRSVRNLLGTLLLATGVPLLRSGDEVGRTQDGNNNPYSTDSELTWLAWDLKDWQKDLLATTQHLAAVRHLLPVLRQRRFFTGREVHEDGSTDLAWYAADGTPMDQERWEDPTNRTVQAFLSGAWLGLRSALIVIHGGIEEVDLALPRPPGLLSYDLLWDSTWERPGRGGRAEPGETTRVGPASMRLYLASDPT